MCGTPRALLSRAKAGNRQKTKRNNESFRCGVSCGQEGSVRKGVFAKEVTSELHFAERDNLFQEAEKETVLAKAWWLRAHGRYVQQGCTGAQGREFKSTLGPGADSVSRGGWKASCRRSEASEIWEQRVARLCSSSYWEKVLLHSFLLVGWSW